MRRIIALVLMVTLTAPTTAHAAAVASIANGSTISVATNTFSKSTLVTVNGKNFDETVGIYLAYCLVPVKGTLPTPCGGGVNKTGTGESSYWISSNPPPYGIGLAIAFTAGGRFSEKVRVTPTLGKFNCRKVQCAITVRSDHLHEGDRTHDIFIPIRFK
ncbi:MAG: hypothetical protein ACKOXI_06630 [Candidatus Planktophila sp.]